MPPTPKPVINRVRSSEFTSSASAEVNMPVEITARHKRISFLRPNRSATGDKNRAPSTIPARPELKTTPKVDG